MAQLLKSSHLNARLFHTACFLSQFVVVVAIAALLAKTKR